MVATSPAFSHRLPHVFPRPDDFDPERFAPPREEDKAAPFSFIGFGGGRHGCMGSNFAILQARAHVQKSPSCPRIIGPQLVALGLSCKLGGVLGELLHARVAVKSVASACPDWSYGQVPCTAHKK